MDNCTKMPLDSLFTTFLLNHVINTLLYWTVPPTFSTSSLSSPTYFDSFNAFGKAHKTHCPWPLFLFSPRTKALMVTI